MGAGDVAVAKQAHVWARDSLDWYVEPQSVTHGLLQVESFPGGVWDPACGQGNIVKAMVARGIDAYGSDVAIRGDGDFPFIGCRDFLVDQISPVANIATNPPFFRAKGAEAFIRRALTLANGKVAAFVDIRFLAGHERATGLFAEHPPARVWLITPRVSCPPGAYLLAGGKAGNGSSDWCWIIWDRTAPRSDTRIGWLDLRQADPIAACPRCGKRADEGADCADGSCPMPANRREAA